MKDIFIANESAVALPVDLISGNKTDTIYAANESRFIEDTFSEPLTAYAVGWKDGGQLQALLDFIAPEVPTSKRFEYFLWTNAEEFQAELQNEDIRAIGSSFKRVEYTSHKANGAVQNKGLTIRVDLDNVDGIPNWREVYTGRLMRRLLRAEAIRAYALLVGIASDTAKTWSSGTPDPDQDLQVAVNSFGDTSGMNPNKVLYGLGAWTKRRTGVRSLNTAGAFQSAVQNIDEVVANVGLDKGFISRERYATSASAKSRIVADKALIFLGEDVQTVEDPSNIKRFVAKTQGGTPFRVYEQQISSKLIDVSVEHYSNIIVTSNLGVQSLTIT